MIGEIITMKWVEKKDWKKALTFAGLSAVGTYLLGFLLPSMFLLSFVMGIGVMYAVLKYIMKYPKNRIQKVIIYSVAINLIIGVVLLVLLLAVVGMSTILVLLGTMGMNGLPAVIG